MQQSSAAPKGVGAYIQFLINEHNAVLVEDESKNRWKLQGGRTAKKKTEGTSWMWLEDFKKGKGNCAPLSATTESSESVQF